MKDAERKVSERWPDKAKIGESAEFTEVNEQLEPIFNAVWPSAASFRQRLEVPLALLLLH
ncbi:hypothetical protein EQG41_11700 [Billgrantia azerbaijanica]|nr:hypothetical protein EQG41_11700 [Halomonas azerbaijanica]